MVSVEEIPTLSVEEYLRFETLAEGRHEYVGGHVYLMSGGSVRHGTLAQLINARLMAAFLPLGCRVHTHDTKLWTPGPAFYYPDVYVTAQSPGDSKAQADDLKKSLNTVMNQTQTAFAKREQDLIERIQVLEATLKTPSVVA